MPSNPKLFWDKILKHENVWPFELRIDFSKGILLTLCVILEGYVLWRIFYPKLSLFDSATPVQKDIVYLILSIINIGVILWVIVKYGKIDLKRLIYYRIPAKSIFFKWVYIAIGMSICNFFIKLPFGLGAQFPDFISRHLTILIVSAILVPIKEEVIFRGIFYSSLRERFGKLYAFLISIFCFVFAHSTIQELIWQGNWSHLFYFLIPFTVIAFVLTYIYETTYSLLLCIIFHSISNGIYHLAPLIGFLYGGYVIDMP